MRSRSQKYEVRSQKFYLRLVRPYSEETSLGALRFLKKEVEIIELCFYIFLIK